MKRIFIWLLATVLLSTASHAGAQQPKKVYRIGYLGVSPINEDFRERLRELGYVEGKNLAIEARLAKNIQQFSALAADLVRLNVDCILAVGVGATREAKNATATIPVVMGNSSDDPVQQGLVDSLARPGGNVPGVTDMLSDIAGKRLELLKETVPTLSRVAHFSPAPTSVGPAHLKATEAAAVALGVQLQALEVTAPNDLEKAFRIAREGGSEAAIVVGVSFFIPHHKRIIDLEIKHRLPAMHTHEGWVPAGGLMTYTTDGAARYRRAAEYVVKILQGTKPADLPIERPIKFRFMINLKTAKQIGLTIPPNVLVRADRVIR
jgi:putative ABC transport system substrate-binding protein